MTGDKLIKKRKAFTIVEALVVMSIFTVLVTSMCDIYVQTSRYGRSIIMRAKLQADARNAIEAIARAIRVSNIDYSSYGGTLPAQPTSELRLINSKTGDTVRIKLSTFDANHCNNDTKSSPCVDISTNGGVGAWAPLSPRGSKIDQLLFYVTPSQDPFLFDQATGLYAATTQPAVTIVMRTLGVGTKPSDNWLYTLQTSVTPRLYLR